MGTKAGFDDDSLFDIADIDMDKRASQPSSPDSSHTKLYVDDTEEKVRRIKSDSSTKVVGPQDADEVDFDSAGNNYDATNVQTALEEIDYRQLVKEPTGFENTTDSELTFTEGSRQISIAPTGSSFDYYIRGKKYTVSSTDTATITDTDGGWFIYYDGDTLTASQTPWAFTDQKAFVAYVYWDATNDKMLIKADERHGLTMDWATHQYLHFTRGTVAEKGTGELQDYIERGGGTLDSHAQVGLSGGTIHDEDLSFNVVNSATPTEKYEQKLNPILYAPVLYRSGASGYWRRLDPTQFPCAWESGYRLKYNEWTGSTWQLTECSEGYFVNAYVAMSTSEEYPVMIILGQNQYNDIADASKEDYYDLTTTIPFPEFYSFYRLIFRTSSDYTNTPKAELYAFNSFVQPSVSEDRYVWTANYNGAAGSGKFLEIYSGQSSDDSPFEFPESAFVKTVILRATASSTGTVGFFADPADASPVFSASLSSETSTKVVLNQFFSEGDTLSLKITSGSISKPHLMVWVQTVL